LTRSTTSRKRWDRATALHLLDFGSPFVRHIVQEVASAQFGGGYAAFRRVEPGIALAAAFLARWQTDQGEPAGEELFVVTADGEGEVALDNRLAARLFDAMLHSAAPPQTPSRPALFEALKAHVEARMAERLTPFLHPNDLVPLAIGEFQ